MVVFVMCLLLLMGLISFRKKYTEAIRSLAQTQVKNATSDLINDAIDHQIKRNGGKTTVRQLTKSVGRKFGLGDKALEMVCVLLHLGYIVDESEPAVSKRTVTSSI